MLQETLCLEAATLLLVILVSFVPNALIFLPVQAIVQVA
jgi:hypothetical protein